MKKKTKKIHSLRFNVWLYFILLLIFTFALLWLFQTVLLSTFYQAVKTNTASKIASQAVSEFSKETYQVDLTLLALDNSACITIYDTSGTEAFSVDTQSGMCHIHSETADFDRLIKQVERSENHNYSETIQHGEFERESLIYIEKIIDASSDVVYVFVETTLTPTESITDIIRLQVLIISAILLVISSTLAFAIADKLAMPIVRLTKSAEKLGQHRNAVVFEQDEYLEVQKLAKTLTYASSEISQTSTLQRDLIANVSHDLRTPLTMIKAYAEMLRDISGENPEKRSEHLGIIIDETDRLAALVQDMLDLSKLESGGQKLNYSTFDITELLDGIVERYTGFCEEKGYKLVYIPDKCAEVRCDEVKIQQVIYNLINNAVNYCGEDKTVTIKQTNSFNTIKIEVSDNGKGIEKDNLHLVFDKYYRAEKTKREVVGTGLGLSIVQAVLKKHGFPFGVVSEVGKGSTFWFKIILPEPLSPDINPKE
ncbi:MAG: HAMP domain-containing histidine kinase [Oscillospiraceae bacterium]|nr:HAMP domain-containing histidine kinase [Oscillospiraceae bacterium]